MSGKSSRAKGRRGEYLVRDLLRSYGFGARRGVAAAGEPDITHDIPGYHIEVKNQERLNIWAALDQAKKDAGEQIPLLFFKRNKSRLYCALPAHLLVYLISQHQQRGIE